MIFVVGGGGLIGSAVIAAINARSLPCTFSSRRAASHKNEYMVDLDAPAQAQLPNQVSVAVLCAWRGGVVECAQDPAGTRRTNVEGLLRLTDRLRAQGAKIIFLSSSLVFDGVNPAPSSDSERKPCCEYGRQKAEVEQALNPKIDAIIRLTKVGETLLPRFRSWAADLRQGRPIAASMSLRFSPVPVEDVARGVAGVAGDFRAGIFQMSATRDYSYAEAAARIAAKVGADAALVRADHSIASEYFQPLPAHGALADAPPPHFALWSPKGIDPLEALADQATN